MQTHHADRPEISGDAQISKTLDGTIIGWSAGAEKLLGYRAEEIIGQPIFRLFPPDRCQKEAAILARLKAGERIEEYRTLRLAKDGHGIEVSLTIIPVKDQAGHIVGALKMMRDITDWKRTEESFGGREEAVDLPVRCQSAWPGLFDASILAGRHPAALTIVALTASTLLRMALTPIFGAGYTFITFYPAIMFSTVVAGWRYGLAATMISAVLSAILFIDPTVNVEHATALLVFLAVNSVMIVLADATGRVRRQAELRANIALARAEGLREEIVTRQAAEQALRRSEHRYRTLVDVTSAVTWTCPPTGLHVEPQPSWMAFTGQTAEEMLGAGWTKVVHPDDLAKAAERWSDTVVKGEPFTNEHRIRRYDGEWRWMSVYAAPIRDADGHVLEWSGMNIDITERKRAEEALQERNRQLELLALASQRLLLGGEAEQDLLETIFGDIAQLIDMDMFYHYRPDETPRMLRLHTSGGITEKEQSLFATMRFGELLCGRVAEGQTRIIIEDLQHSTHHGSDVLRAAGATSYAGFPLVAKGELVGTIAFTSNRRTHLREGDVLMIQTICDQIATALERTRLQRELRESEARFRNVFEYAATGIAIAHLDGRFVQCNPAYCTMLGYTEEELRDSDRVFPDLVHPDDRAANLAEIKQILAEQLPYFEIENRYVHKSGESIWVHKFVSLLRDYEGQPKYLAALVTDVTERRRADEELRNARERLQRWNVELEQAVNIKTAELKQSQERLRAFATELNLAEQRERMRIATELHDHLQQMLVLGKLKLGMHKRFTETAPAAAKVMKETDEVLSDALTYSRMLVAELSPPVLRDHGLAAGFKWLADSMKQKYGMAVTVTVPEEHGLKLPEDQTTLLFQSVRELLINSWKHAGTGQATVSMERRDGLLWIEVGDTGAGFDLAAAAAAAADTPSGGISSKFGLFSIRERMRALDGSFNIESSPGRGTTATLVLPLGGGVAARSEDTGLRTEFSKKPVGRQPSRISSLSDRSALSTQSSAFQKNPKVRVLLVDDHAMVRQGLRSVLDAYEDLQVIAEAGDGAEAIKLVGDLHPRVVVMDINMPKMSGIEATAQIMTTWPDTIIIGISVNSEDDNSASMKRAGAVIVLAKDKAVEDLHAVIKRETTPVLVEIRERHDEPMDRY